MCAWNFGHTPLGHCSSSTSPTGSHLKGLASPTEAYSCDLHVLYPGGDGLQVTCMTADDWHQAQRADPVLSLMIIRMQDGTLGHSPCRPTDPSKLHQFLWEHNHLRLRQGILYRSILPKGLQKAQFQLVLPAMYWETTLRGCHDEVGHLGLEHMLNLMCDHFFWPGMATQAKEHIERWHQCSIFEEKQQQAPKENIVATHPLELVHIDYLCLEPGKDKEENVLAVMDHFTHYTLAYINQFQITQTMTKALWDNFIVHYRLPENIPSDQGIKFESELKADLCKLMGTSNSEPAHTTCTQMASARDSTIPSLIC